MNYQEVLDFLYSQLPMFQRIGKLAFNKDLSKTIKLLESLGNPERDLRCIHVAGTNGKGSTSHMIAAALQTNGYKVGLYTSPHLISFTERIRINGVELDKDFVVSFVNEYKDLILEVEPSFFEITVAMAFQYFKEHKVDFAVIEVGLGGRLDSTNVITPLVSVITSIAMDHQDILGNTIQEIAMEKGGIIKQSVPVVIGKINTEPRRVLVDLARNRSARLNDQQSNYEIIWQDQESITISKGKKEPVTTIKSELKGKTIQFNLPIVLEVLEELKIQGIELIEEKSLFGISNVVSLTGLRGRWQILRQSPLVICDIGHNEEAVQGLMDQINTLAYDNLHIVWGMAKDKAVDEVMKILIKEAKYYFCAANLPRALPADELLLKGRENGLNGSSFSTVMDAYQDALQTAGQNDLIFVGGSTFVVAELKDI